MSDFELDNTSAKHSCGTRPDSSAAIPSRHPSWQSREPTDQGPGIGPGSFFGIGPCDNLVYDPGSVAFPDQPVEADQPDGEIRSAVTPDWYETVSAC